LVRWVIDDIERLKESDNFTVIFFRHGQVIEVPPVGLKHATQAGKNQVCDWLVSAPSALTLGGWSDPLDAIDIAMTYGTEKLFILSDDSFGRSLLVNDSSFIANHIQQQLAGQSVSVNTVQFYYIDSAHTLENLAAVTGGRYEFISPLR